MGGTSFILFFCFSLSFFFFFFFFFFLDWPGFSNYTSKPDLGLTMGQEKSLQRAWAFEHLPQARNWANNGPKRKEPAKGLNGLGPLNICLKLEIGTTMGQRERSQQRA
jgi:hypothetical protein